MGFKGESFGSDLNAFPPFGLGSATSPQKVSSDATLVAHVRTNSNGSATLSIHRDGVLSHTEPLRVRKKESIRFTVGDLEDARLRGNTWIISTGKKEDDIYVLARGWEGKHKFSLHASGDWRYQLQGLEVLSDRPASYAPSGDRSLPTSRILHRWYRPSPDESGWMEVMRIVTPRADLRHNIYIDEKDVAKTRCIPAPPSKHVSDIRVFVVEPGKGSWDLFDGNLKFPVHSGGFVHGKLLPSGKALLVFFAAYKASQRETEAFAQARKHSDIHRPSHMGSKTSNSSRILGVMAQQPFPVVLDLAPRARRIGDSASV